MKSNDDAYQRALRGFIRIMGKREAGDYMEKISPAPKKKVEFRMPKPPGQSSLDDDEDDPPDGIKNILKEVCSMKGGKR
jgi:hypothetical protein